jgi:hypothetical protein
VADYQLRCPFCGGQTVDGRCPSCAQGPVRRSPAGTSSSREVGHVDLAEGARYAGETDRLALYTPVGGRRSLLARAATVLAASLGAGLLILLTSGLAIGLLVSIWGALVTTSVVATALLLVLAALQALALVILGTGLSIVWRHRDDYAAQRQRAPERR